MGVIKGNLRIPIILTIREQLTPDILKGRNKAFNWEQIEVYKLYFILKISNDILKSAKLEVVV